MDSTNKCVHLTVFCRQNLTKGEGGCVGGCVGGRVGRGVGGTLVGGFVGGLAGPFPPPMTALTTAYPGTTLVRISSANISKLEPSPRQLGM